MTVGPLTEESLVSFRDCLRAVFVEAKEGGSREITDGRWRALDTGKNKLLLVESSGKFISISSHGSGKPAYPPRDLGSFFVDAGWIREGSSACLGIEIMTRGNGIYCETSSYHFSFKGQALAGLKTLLGLNEKSLLQEVALEVMARVRASGQYVAKDLPGDADFFRAGKRIKIRDGRFPEGLAPDRRRFTLESRARPHRVGEAFVFMEGGRNIFDVTLFPRRSNRRRRPAFAFSLMPLEQSLRQLLWEGFLIPTDDVW